MRLKINENINDKRHMFLLCLLLTLGVWALMLAVRPVKAYAWHLIVNDSTNYNPTNGTNAVISRKNGKINVIFNGKDHTVSGTCPVYHLKGSKDAWITGSNGDYNSNQNKTIKGRDNYYLYMTTYGHNWENKGSGATCTAAGHTWQQCSRCSTTQNESWPAALGHDWSTTSTTSATCTAAAVVYQKCNRCGATQSYSSGSALGHLWSGWQYDGTNHWQNCQRGDSNYHNKAAHNYGAWSGWSNGKRTRKCGTCGYTQTGTCSHTSGYNVQKTSSYTTHDKICKVCSSNLGQENHSWGDWTGWTISNGERRRSHTCKNCGFTAYQSWVSEWNYTISGNNLYLKSFTDPNGTGDAYKDGYTIYSKATIDGTTYQVYIGSGTAYGESPQLNTGKITDLSFAQGVRMPANSSQMFYKDTRLKSLNLDGLNTAGVTDMSWMFGYLGVKDLDVSGFNTSAAVNMRGMFTECENITKLDLSSFNTQNVTSMREMFAACSRLETLYQNLNTGKVTDMTEMFADCSAIPALNLSGFRTNENATIDRMFQNDSKLTALDLSEIRVSSAKDAFSGCRNIVELHLGTANIQDSGLPTPEATKRIAYTGGWTYDEPYNHTEASASNSYKGKQTAAELMARVSGGTAMAGTWFAEIKGGNWLDSWDYTLDDESGTVRLKAYNGSGSYLQDTEETEEEIPTYMVPATGSKHGKTYKVVIGADDGAPVRTGKIQNLSFESGVTFRDDAASLFSGNTGLESVSLNGVDTENVTNMASMFKGDTALSNVAIEQTRTKNVTDMSSMFEDCASLTALDLSSFDTRSVTSMNAMFKGAAKLRKLDISGFNTSSVSDMADMLNTAGGDDNTSSLAQLTLGENFRFGEGAGLQRPADVKTLYGNTQIAYTDKWTYQDPYVPGEATEDNQYLGAQTPSELMARYDGDTMAGTWYAQINGISPKQQWYYSVDGETDGAVNIVDPALKEGETGTVSIGGKEYTTHDMSYTDLRSENHFATNDEGNIPGYWTIVDDNTWTYTFNVHDENVDWRYDEKDIEHYTKTLNTGEIAADAPSKEGEIINTNEDYKKGGRLIIRKELKEADGSTSGDTQTPFTFRLKITDENDATLQGTETFGGLVFTDGIASFTLTGGQSRTFSDIPYGYRFSVSEDEKNGYDSAFSQESGTIGEDDVTVVCTNTRKEDGETRTITVEKAVSGTEPESGAKYRFTLHLYGLNGYQPYTLGISGTERKETASKSGELSFPFTLAKDESAVIEGIPAYAKADVTEEGTSGCTPAYSVDGSDEEIGNKGLPLQTSEIMPGSTVSFTNYFDEAPAPTPIPEKDPVTLVVKKETSGDETGHIGEKYTVYLSFTGLAENTRYTIKPSEGSETVFGSDKNGEADAQAELKKGGSFRIENLPQEASVTVSEDKGEYTPSYKVSAETEDEKTGESGQVLSTDEIHLSGAKETDDGKAVEVTFTNTFGETEPPQKEIPNPSYLTLKKEVTGDADDDDEYTFFVTFKGLEKFSTWQFSKGDAFQADGDGEADAVVKLKADETADITIPAGTSYQVGEAGGNWTAAYQTAELDESGNETGERTEKTEGERGKTLQTAEMTAEKDEHKEVVFTNAVERVQTLTVKNIILDENGEETDADKDFWFDISFGNIPEGKAIQSSIGNIEGEADGTADRSFHLNNEDTATFSFIPAGTTVKVTKRANEYVSKFSITEMTADTSNKQTKLAWTTLATETETIKKDENGLITFTSWKPQTGKLRIHKKTEDTDEPMEGAVFEIYTNIDGAEDDTLVATVTTGEDGYTEWTENMEVGREYILKETKTPYHYDPVEDQTVTIESGGEEKTVELKDPRSKTATYTFVKLTSDGQPLPGAEYKLYREDGSFIKDITFTTKGVSVDETELELGTYYLEETVAPKGYFLDGEKRYITVTEADLGMAVEVKLYDGALYNLPSTGGTGTSTQTNALAVLSVLALCAAYVSQKRKRKAR